MPHIFSPPPESELDKFLTDYGPEFSAEALATWRKYVSSRYQELIEAESEEPPAPDVVEDPNKVVPPLPDQKGRSDIDKEEQRKQFEEILRAETSAWLSLNSARLKKVLTQDCEEDHPDG